ncbi:unnamed protein product [Polarella glacialis]|uniref:Uncharacterized protein n=1 Tax=Polarella glacialis TaxID=89957 RepID=A0A813KFH2_POLGL|nr:unnamed protein product [Polarella glacialis]CAE8700566.1 unnamed protein product [Polarella glacialis]|mmetsp:Transcript_65176/g.105393  ORF Transcript_65176/g.105393 Transcript_65176/m.105393 type:complete len:109 (-) Transcript_65176:110-436(-)|eukprot:CAMPEP_0115088292 /NCGR_PEP_ID=MMETSP0227-20121206/23898_1 /TAXON_ID=89957 /ORGANISM="Polarella glacialis, Strain CCMP 1383" /LENGTH=108 /DNA_ID=CAMNT_0002478521 /DNA_START=67 /DNA_END=393 /DNA_ORIENTATION=-
MEKDDGKNAQYKTIKRLQKHYLVRCNESLSNIIPGTGVKPASAIRRLENEIKQQRDRFGKLIEEELIGQMDSSNQKKAKNAQELSARKVELTERIKQLEKQLLEYELL